MFATRYVRQKMENEMSTTIYVRKKTQKENVRVFVADISTAVGHNWSKEAYTLIYSRGTNPTEQNLCSRHKIATNEIRVRGDAEGRQADRRGGVRAA